MKPIYIYVLKCQQNKYYIGRTSNPQNRFDQHLSGCASQWTKLFPVEQKVLEFQGDVFDEDKLTKVYMSRYGIENVRGGAYSNVHLNSEQLYCLEKELRNAKSACFHCGSLAHFAKDCHMPISRLPAPQKLKSFWQRFITYVRQTMWNLLWKPKQQREEEEDDPLPSPPPEEENVNYAEDILGQPLYTSEVFNSIPYEKYIVNASKLLPAISNWAYNRPLNHDHLRKLEVDILTMKHPHFIGSIKIARSQKDKHTMKIIDGFHRHQCLMNIMKENPYFDMPIDLDVYYVDDVETCDMDMRELFIKANKNLNIQQEDVPEIKIIEVINKMIELWGTSIKTDENKGAYRPNVTKRALYEAMKNHPKKFKDKSSVDIFKRIIQINNMISTMPMLKLFGRSEPSKGKLSTYERAKTKNFYLNMDCKYSLEKWIEIL